MANFQRNTYDNNDLPQDDLDNFVGGLLLEMLQAEPVPQELQDCAVIQAFQEAQWPSLKSVNSVNPANKLISFHMDITHPNNVLFRDTRNPSNAWSIVYTLYFEQKVDGGSRPDGTQAPGIRKKLQRMEKAVWFALTQNNMDEDYTATINGVTYQCNLSRNKKVASELDNLYLDYDKNSSLQSSISILFNIYKN